MVTHRTETAVSIVTCGDKLVLLKRKKRDGDPWSGDMCFPGGFVKDEEVPIEAALRELREETSIDTSDLEMKGELPVFHPVRSPHINVHPFWFYSEELADIIPGDEIERGKWYTVGEYQLKHDKVRGEFIVWNGDIVWGLTYRIYSAFLQRSFGH